MTVDRSEPQVSAIIAVTLDSQLFPPFQISKESATQQELLQNNIIQNEKAIVVNSTSSMMNINLMLQWMRHLLIKFVKLQRQKYPLQNRHEAALIVDNMTAHCNKDAKDILEVHSIILLTLPHYSTHFTQPCDVGIFGALKLYYQQNREGIAKLELIQIAARIIDASQKATSLLTIKNCFATCAVLSVVKGEHLKADVNAHAFDDDIQQLQADNSSITITLTPTDRKRKTAKFGILNS
ncbi:MAG: hypothetical protein EZS28_033662 [Streblomastix strix]|uniref:DDE-1 domain-containing protein n=1 Tax=Streblomastix strix TaxID=222440 RepID=A0A5J4ULA3_9EUKA|nr:MAG: hypothetical protein EZS28_033662 [Streblomastix strix]